MSKYFLFFKNSVTESLIYRANIFFLFFSQLTSLGIYIFLWWAIYEQGGVVGEYSLDSLVVYYLISTFIGFTIQGPDVAWKVGDEVSSGVVTGLLLQPINYIGRTFSVILGKTVFNLSLMVGLLLFFALFKFDLVWLGVTDWERNGFFLIAILLALGINFFIFS